MAGFVNIDPDVTGTITVEGFEDTPIICGQIDPQELAEFSLRKMYLTGSSAASAYSNVENLQAEISEDDDEKTREAKVYMAMFRSMPEASLVDEPLELYKLSARIIRAGFRGVEGADVTVDEVIAQLGQGNVIRVASEMLEFCDLPESEKKSFSSLVEHSKPLQGGESQKSASQKKSDEKTNGEKTQRVTTTVPVVGTVDFTPSENAETRPELVKESNTLPLHPDG